MPPPVACTQDEGAAVDSLKTLAFGSCFPQFPNVASVSGLFCQRSVGGVWQVVHVDADPCVLGANFAPDVAVLGDVVEVLRLLLGLLQQQARDLAAGS